MIRIVNFEGVKAIVQKPNFKIFTIAFLAIAAFTMNACTSNSANSSTTTTTTSGVDPNEAAATVNGKAIKLEEVERGIKQQGQGQEGKFSALELAAARLQVLNSLIQEEVLYQKAEKEQTVPTDDKVIVEYNKQKTGSGLSAEQFDAKLKEIGETDASARDKIKRTLAIEALIEKVTGKIEPPKDSEIEAFFKSDPESFKRKRGAQLAAIVIDPANNGQGDTTTNDIEAQQKAKEVGQRVLQGADFATVARETSEEPNTRTSGGDWRYFSEEEMKQTLGAGVADYVMNKMQNGQVIPQAIPLEGKILIIKLQSKLEKDEDLTLESPKVRQQITDYLINQRKELLKQSFAAMAMNEAKIENSLAQKIVNNPNELSGARPATTPNVNANTTANSNVNTTANVNANTKAETKPPSNANVNVKK